MFAVVFPQDLLEKGLEANNFAMLGLGDIVIPGILIALLLRFDVRYVVTIVSLSLALLLRFDVRYVVTIVSLSLALLLSLMSGMS